MRIICEAKPELSCIQCTIFAAAFNDSALKWLGSGLAGETLYAK